MFYPTQHLQHSQVRIRTLILEGTKDVELVTSCAKIMDCVGFKTV